MFGLQSDLRFATHIAASAACYLNSIQSPESSRVSTRRPTLCFGSPAPGLRASFGAANVAVEKRTNKPSICTADELHYVSVSNSDWRLALWRYRPSLEAPQRNHPLLLLSGVGTNAIGFDLSPESSFARYMSSQGFDTWILEVRGAGLSTQGTDIKESVQPVNAISEQSDFEFKHGRNGVSSAESKSTINSYVFPESNVSSVGQKKISVVTKSEESLLVTRLTETFMRLSERLSGFLNEGQSRVMSAKLFDQLSKLIEDAQLNERFNDIRGKLSGLLETRQNSAIASQIRDLSQRLVNIIAEGQQSVSPQFLDLQERFSATIEDFQKELDLIVKYDWDFDHYLEEDVPAAMQYVRTECKPKDGKLLAIGHSMGGILLYAALSKHGFDGRDAGLISVVTLGSSLDYMSSKSSLKLILPLADPAQAFNVPAVPIGALLAAAYPLASRPPYVLSWLNPQISAQDMMHPELFKKLVLNNFCLVLFSGARIILLCSRQETPMFVSLYLGTVPTKLLLQLRTAFREGGLCDRSGTFFYKNHLSKSNVPILAVAGDQDLICPPEAIYETVKVIPKHLVTHRVFGEPGGPHYGHYDLVGGRLAPDEIYPCIIEFLSRHDMT